MDEISRIPLTCSVPSEVIEVSAMLYLEVVQMRSNTDYRIGSVVNLINVKGELIASIQSLDTIWSELVELTGALQVIADPRVISQVESHIHQLPGGSFGEITSVDVCFSGMIQTSGKLQIKMVDDFKISLVEHAGKIYGIDRSPVDKALWLRTFMNNVGRGVN